MVHLPDRGLTIYSHLIGRVGSDDGVDGRVSNVGVGADHMSYAD